ncbi:gp71 [Burkholderia phage Bcep1]|uniref:Gp71 n=1 Tax=Burkholderia phage Bcep1 TaxID=2883943 RepID=Q6UIW1_9CAUD|nr:Lar-like restriction alleviation protein [Burkholderia phage Bcep1]AAQ73417.2 gp71 [Burkholderia phage Bcep1]
MSDTTKSCPHCGYNDLDMRDDRNLAFRVVCLTCAASGPIERTEEEALTSWNARTE